MMLHKILEAEAKQQPLDISLHFVCWIFLFVKLDVLLYVQFILLLPCSPSWPQGLLTNSEATSTSLWTLRGSGHGGTTVIHCNLHNLLWTSTPGCCMIPTKVNTHLLFQVCRNTHTRAGLSFFSAPSALLSGLYSLSSVHCIMFNLCNKFPLP